jgi:hypothetical protein
MALELKTTSPDAGTSIAALDSALEVDAGDATIAIKKGRVVLSKSSAAAIALAAPTAGLPSAGGDDGRILQIVSITAAAHVITSSVRGFNGKGSSGTITFAANKGSATDLIAYNGDWYTLAGIGATVA